MRSHPVLLLSSCVSLPCVTKIRFPVANFSLDNCVDAPHPTPQCPAQKLEDPGGFPGGSTCLQMQGPRAQRCTFSLQCPQEPQGAAQCPGRPPIRWRHPTVHAVVYTADHTDQVPPSCHAEQHPIWVSWVGFGVEKPKGFLLFRL